MGQLLAERLKTRADFLRAQRGVRRSTPALTLEVCPTPEQAAKLGRFRVGFTASRKVGGAVQRNRAKRRLREAARIVLATSGRECTDYVLVARTATLDRPFAALVKDLASAVAAAHLRLGAGDTRDQLA